MIKAIIFDLDGVLVTTDTLHYAAWKETADREGIYFDRKINHRLRGVGRMECVDILLERARRPYSSVEKAALAQHKNAYYQRLLEFISPKNILPGAVSVLEQLKAAGYRLAVGSSSANAKTILEKLQLSAYFDAVSDGNNISHSKPNPEVFLKAAEMLGVSPAECAVVEDAPAGIEAAKAAGMVAFGMGEAATYPMTDHSLTALSGIIPILQQA